MTETEATVLPPPELDPELQPLREKAPAQRTATARCQGCGWFMCSPLNDGTASSKILARPS